jgi:hypothetical protein
MELPKEVRDLFSKHGLTVRVMQGYCRVQGGKNPVEFRMRKSGQLGFRVGNEGNWSPVEKLSYLIGLAHADL